MGSMILSTDLHIHSCYSMATSNKMVITTIGSQAKLKGLDLVGTGDGFHPKWLQIIENSTTEEEEGIYSTEDCNFVLTNEVEDKNRVHHLLILPNIESAYEIRKKMLSYNLDRDGRPKIRLNGAQIMDLVREFDGIIGPSHAFTPWTSLYKEYNSIFDCYGKKPDFIELGLSADTDMADKIAELYDIPFLSNSDAHSPWPHRLGREFNEIEVKQLNYSSIKDAIKKQKIITNYGFDPRLGKYHETACVRCYKTFTIEEAKRLKMKCPCGGTIKKGVKDRISDIADWETPKHPKNRPPYIHILPLAEIIHLTYNKGIYTAFVQKIWKELVQKFGNEISVLIYASLNDISKIDEKLAQIIKAFRDNTLQIMAGGGGRYGKILFEQNTLDSYLK
jgi:uncharacterized protein (TIGR00375 family)